MTTAPNPPSAPTPSRYLATLPKPMPDNPNSRLLLFAFRRMGAHGVHDAHAAHAIFQAFGQNFRRPLLLLRTMMADLAHHATGPITIAPCCCMRMTASEAAILTIVDRAETAPESARLLLGDLIGLRRPDGVLASITAVAQAFADAGRPLTP